MPVEPKIRRGRREDFAAVSALLARAGVSLLRNRADIRRFRHIAADLGSDLYVAEIGGALVGLVYVTYTRQLAGGQTGRIEHLAVAPATADGVVEALLDHAARRARKRACAALTCAPQTAGVLLPEVIERLGLVPAGTEYRSALGSEG